MKLVLKKNIIFIFPIDLETCQNPKFFNIKWTLKDNFHSNFCQVSIQIMIFDIHHKLYLKRYLYMEIQKMKLKQSTERY